MTLTDKGSQGSQVVQSCQKRDTRVGLLDAEMQARISAVDGSAFRYAMYLSTHANAAGDVIDSRALAAEHFHVHIRTITRWRASLVRAGFLMPYAGGHKGMCLRAVIKRFVSDTTAFIARRALAAAHLARKARHAELARHARENPRTNACIPKGDMSISRLISQESSLEDFAESTLDDTAERPNGRMTPLAADLLASMRRPLPRGGRVSAINMRVVRHQVSA